jgi:hypothetical protein
VVTLLLTLKIAFAEAAGFIVLAPACVLQAWTAPNQPSIKPSLERPTVDRWSWNWLNAWYSNTEDGVSGQQALVWDANGKLVPYASLYPSWTPKCVIAYGWSAWRNGANNLKRPLRNDTWTK